MKAAILPAIETPAPLCRREFWWVFKIFNRMNPINYIASGLLATSSAAAVVTNEANDVWRLVAVLSVGTSLGVLWSCLSKEGNEEKRMTRARILAGVVGGMCIPTSIEALINGLTSWHFSLSSWHPLVIFFIGFVFAVGGFYVVHTALRKVERRQNAIGGLLEKTVEKSIAKAVGMQPPKDDENESDSTGQNTSR